jgi:hypothetical protein
VNLDVTPVGRQAGEPVEAPKPVGRNTTPDPFGSRPSVRRRGWLRMVLGVAALVGGIVVAVFGILEAVESSGNIEGDAVARGTVSVGAQPLTFDVPAGGTRDYTVYLIFPKGNFVNRELEEDAAVRTTTCRATRPGGDTHTFRGSRQGVAQTIGRASTVGHFASAPGQVRLHCAYVDGSRRSNRRRFDSVPYVVTPGKPTFTGGGTLLIVGGVFGAIGGGFLFGWGWKGSRRPL